MHVPLAYWGVEAASTILSGPRDTKREGETRISGERLTQS